MTLPMIFAGDEVTVIYAPGTTDDDNPIRCLVVAVEEWGYDFQLADDLNGEVWSAMLTEEAAGLWRIVDHHPAPKPPLTAGDIA